MKKGFTLVELLAVIVILGVISVITIPVITSTVENSKKGAFEDTALGILKVAKQTYLDYAGEKMHVDMEDYIIDINDESTGIKMTYSGSSPKGGYVEISKEGVATLIIYNEDYCAYKLNDKDSIAVKKISSPSECTSDNLNS
jgi:type IV pilus assembly protein PilA